MSVGRICVPLYYVELSILPYNGRMELRGSPLLRVECDLLYTRAPSVCERTLVWRGQA